MHRWRVGVKVRQVSHSVNFKPRPRAGLFFGTRMVAAIFPLVLPQRWPTRPPPRLCGVPAGELLRVLAKHLLDGSNPGRQTEALEVLSTSCQAVLRLGTSASDEGVVIVVMDGSLPASSSLRLCA
jgi:hypothetical protein